MRRPQRLFARLLGCLLLMQWAVALAPHARAMAASGNGLVVEICSPEGMRLMRLGEDGQPVEQKQAPMQCCVLCQAPAAILATAPEGPSLRIAYVDPPRALRMEGLPVSPPQAPPPQPRAPPHI